MTDLLKIARERIDDSQRTHWEGCERDHRECLIQRMADEIERLRAERDALARWKSTHAPRIEALQGLKDHAQAEAALGAEARATLESERAANAMLTDEIERLRVCLKKANDQTEHFEREWYLRGDEIERLRAENFALAAHQCANASGDNGGTPVRLEVLRLRAERDADTALMRQALDAMYSLVRDHVTVFSHETIAIDALEKRVGDKA